ncbi:MAG: septum site-determining protein MinD [Clostridia bacterium]|nr:septum site-determining protein MinD [Clostridia bacterium]
MSSVISVASGKGGTGKSTFAVNCGAALAESGRKVLLIDADAGLRALDLLLGVSDKVVYDLGDVLAGLCEPVKAIVDTGRAGLFLLPAPQSPPDAAFDTAGFGRLCKGLAKYYDYVLIDSPAGVDRSVQAAAAAGERAIVVATPDPVCIRDADRAAQMLLAHSVTHLRLVLNRVNPKMIREGRSMNLDTAIDGASLQLIGVVPEDAAVAAAAFAGEPLSYRRKGAARAFYNIAGRLEGRDIPLMKL